MSVADKLLQINQAKKDIKVAIENKYVDLLGVDFSSYAEKIDALPAVVELTQAQYDALSVNALVWGNPSALAETEVCSIDGVNPLGTSCSIEGEKMTVAGADIGMSSGCYEITCISSPTNINDNTYYLIVEDE